jgi:signal transduction histidine kinase/CheY-like chemotaxis protein
MRLPPSRVVLPWLIGFSLSASLGCLLLALYFGFGARADAMQTARRAMAAQADILARQIEADLTLFDLALRDAAAQSRTRDPAQPPPRSPLLELPLTARYIGFINILNEIGDVVADPKANVSRPANFAGRDYFQEHLKNPADVLMVGRPFATAPTQHPSIPISRRLNRPDGGFAGVVVAGLHLTWLSELVTHLTPSRPLSIAIRRDDGVILMRAPMDMDAIGRGTGDAAFQSWLRTGLTATTDEAGGIRLFRRLAGPPLVLELAQEAGEIAAGEQWSWLLWLPPLALIPGLCVLGLGVLSHRFLRLGHQIEAQSRAANDEHMRLLANMSHELRTPLTGILGQAEMLTDEGGLNEHQTKRLNLLTEAGALMRTVVNRVIDVARPDDRPDKPVLESCDLDRLAQVCLGVVEGEARRKGLRLTSTIDPGVPRQVMLARDLVQQVLINLLMNAVKFTARGTIAMRITGDPTRLWFEVADTGPGIPASKRRRLFREYDRLDRLDSRAEGTGLGLSISERFIQRMGGRIGSIESRAGGSVFWVELPITETVAPDALAAEAVAPPDETDSWQRRVLLADDLDLTRSVTADYLRSAGHLVTEVADGEAVMDAILRQNFDVVLTDMRMPVVDGLEVARRIRALPGPRGRTPVVLVTADLVAIGQGASEHSGVDICLMKPFTRTELLAAVASAVHLAPARQWGSRPIPFSMKVCSPN